VDKTALVDAVLDSSAQALLLPRPRRFGKTLGLSMLRYFFEKSAEDRSPLFAGLHAFASEQARPHFQRYPTLFLTFKDVKAATWTQCLDAIAGVLARVCGEHQALLGQDRLMPQEAAAFTALLERRASEVQCWEALELLSRLLAERHQERVIILIDEYDTPLHAGYVNHYYDEVVTFFRNLLSGGMKDNPYLFKGILTGILRVAKESVFSGLNNLSVYGILRPEFATSFGFTEAEVRSLVDEQGRSDVMDDIRAYYNGYLFGGEPIYNPWSVLSFLDSADKELRPYWVSTGSNDLVRELLVTGHGGVKTELEVLLKGGSIDKPVQEDIVLRDVSARSEALWSFLLFSGYLKAVDLYKVDDVPWAHLAVPNREVLLELTVMARAWMESQAGGAEEVRRMLDALLRGDAPAVERALSRVVKVNASFFDTAGPEPERFYHGLVVGLLASLGARYEVRSNRESGYGRCDVLILPRTAGRPGVALELKTVEADQGETPEAALAVALQQIDARDYATELRERGADPIHLMAAAFDGKRAYVRSAVAPGADPKPLGES
jgi:hypothetical protein